MTGDDFKQRVGCLLWAIRAIRHIEPDKRSRIEDYQSCIDEIHRLTNEALETWNDGLGKPETPHPKPPPTRPV